MAAASCHRRSGSSLAELLVVLTLIGALASIGVPRAAALVDRVSVRGAAQDVALALSAARAAASQRGIYASFVADSSRGSVRAVAGGEKLFERDLTKRGVHVTASRDSITFAPGGLGWGAANTTVVVSRGARADTIVLSRLGRVRTAW